MARTITLDHITKIEGHASLNVKVKDGKVAKCELGSTEGARFFEGLVKGRTYDDGVEMTMRICGICSVAHFTASTKAMEEAMNVKTSKQTRVMRDVLAIGERLRSHATHLYFLSLPDFLGYESALAMASAHKKEVGDALQLMKAGNDLVSAFGGRQMHPMSGRVGGFTRHPTSDEVRALQAQLKAAEAPALRTLKLFLKMEYPDLWVEREHLSLQQPKGYPLISGDVTNDDGRVIKADDYARYFREYVNRWSTAKFVVKEGKSFLLGALARVNNHYHLVDEDVQALVEKAGVHFPTKNPFHNLVAQAVELVHWTRAGQKLLAPYATKGFKKEKITLQVQAGTGVGVVEAPRGLLFHTYTLDAKGKITRANIMTPTSQNLKAMQEDVQAYLQQLLDHKTPKKKIPLEIEKLIRAYDPCFSCSTHFLKINWDEGAGGKNGLSGSVAGRGR